MNDARLALVARGLHKRFFVKETKQMVQAITDVSLEVETGTLAALLGPDGAGKTTLLRMITGLLTPDEGQTRRAGDQCCQATHNRYRIASAICLNASAFMKI